MSYLTRNRVIYIPLKWWTLQQTFNNQTSRKSDFIGFNFSFALSLLTNSPTHQTPYWWKEFHDTPIQFVSESRLKWNSSKSWWWDVSVELSFINRRRSYWYWMLIKWEFFFSKYSLIKCFTYLSSLRRGKKSGVSLKCLSPIHFCQDL